jgi:hypothetical protein
MWGSKRDGTLGAAAARHARLGGATGGRSGARRILIQLPRSSAMPQRRKWRNGLTGVSQTPASRGPRGRAEADHGSQYHKGLPPLMRKLVCVNAKGQPPANAETQPWEGGRVVGPLFQFLDEVSKCFKNVFYKVRKKKLEQKSEIYYIGEQRLRTSSMSAPFQTHRDSRTRARLFWPSCTL